MFEGLLRTWVNAEGLSVRSRLKVELLDEAERPVAGYSGADAVVVEQSGTRLALRWKNGVSLDALRIPFRFRVSCEGEQSQQIRFYALQVGP
jgi:hypothetical protein